jgi:hypothetical protein
LEDLALFITTPSPAAAINKSIFTRWLKVVVFKVKHRISYKKKVEGGGGDVLAGRLLDVGLRTLSSRKLPFFFISASIK